MIRSYVYFHGPLTEWERKPHSQELVAQFECRWQWLANARALAALKNLNSGRCGMCVEDSDGNVVKHIEAPVRQLAL